MKKPKFNQLYGTYAHSLRHRICLGFTLGAFLVCAISDYGLAKLIPEPGKRAEEFARHWYSKLGVKKKKEFYYVKIDDDAF